MIEIRCTRENVREAVSDCFPNPTPGQDVAINAVVRAVEQEPVELVHESKYLGVKVTIVPDEPLPHMHDEYDDKPCLACVQENPSRYRTKRDAERETLGEALGIQEESPEFAAKVAGLSASQAKIPNTPEEDDAWRVLESQRATEGLEQHAARRHIARPGVYDMSQPADEVFNRVTLTPLTKTGFLAAAGIVANAKHVASIHDAEYYAVDNANTGQVYLEDDTGNRHRLSDLQSRGINGDREARGMLRAALLSGSYAQAMRHQLLEVATLTPADYTARDKANKDIQTLGEQLGIDNANTAEVGTFTDGPEERYSAQPIGFYGAFVVEDRQNPTDWIAKCVKQEFAQLIVDALNAWEASQ